MSTDNDINEAVIQIRKYGFFRMYSDILREDVLIMVRDVPVSKIPWKLRKTPKYTMREAELMASVTDENEFREIHRTKVRTGGTIVGDDE